MKTRNQKIPEIVPEWSRNYIANRALKRLISKAVKAGGASANDDSVIFFTGVLDRELEKVNSFFLRKHFEMELLLERYRSFNQSSSSTSIGNETNGLNASNFDPYADKEFLSAMVETKDQLHRLFHFANMNNKKFIKIIKKFDKMVGCGIKDLHLKKALPFISNYELLAESLDSLERMVQETRHRIDLQGELTPEDRRIFSNDDAGTLKELINHLPPKKTLTCMLSKACHFQARQCIKLLLDSGADIADGDDINGRSFIHKLAIYGGNLLPQDSRGEDIGLLSFILESLPETERQKVSFKDIFGKMPLHYAAIKGFARLTAVLLEFLIQTEQLSSNGPSLFDNNGFTPIQYATIYGHTEVVNCIIRISNITDFNDQHVTPRASYNLLAIACRFGHSSTVRLLLSYGADPDIRDEEEETPLHECARNGFIDCVKILVGLDGDANKSIRRADVEIKERLYGWTPLFLAAVKGHTNVARVLVEAGANPNIVDNSGWTPRTHAVFRGYRDVKKVLEKSPLIEEPSLSFSNGIHLKPSHNLNGESAVFGSNYLQDQSLILVALGNNSDNDVSPVEFFSDIPLTSTSFIVSARNASGEVIIDLSSAIDPIKFYSSSSDVILLFDFIPSYIIKEPAIKDHKAHVFGRATALLSSVKTFLGPRHTSLRSSVTVPILGKNSLEVIGRVHFEFLVVKPFKHENLAIDHQRTHWTDAKVIGHRGSGANKAGFSSIQENTLMSFIAAEEDGVEYIEFDVQVTRDLIPVIYHDWTITETGYPVPIHTVTREQFLNIKRRLENDIHVQNGTNYQNDSPNGSISSINHSEENGANLNGKLKIQAPFATLAGTFEQVPAHVGFNVEIKYPLIDEAEDHNGLPSCIHIEMNLYVDSILKCVFDHAKDRNVIFSSFHPDVCLMLASKQPDYPVFFLTCGGMSKMINPKCNSLREAIRFAKSSNLAGIVTNSTPVIEAPKLVKTVKEEDLLLFTYGSMNNVVENALLQRSAGVDAVIVDRVKDIINGLRE